MTTAITASSRIPGFYRLPVERRLALLARRFALSAAEIEGLRRGGLLRIEDAVNMVENVVGVLGLPIGLGMNFQIDGVDRLVPMAVEEASIVAAASKAALLVRRGGGFLSQVDDPVMIGQIHLEGITDIVRAKQILRDNQQQILEIANRAEPRMVGRGGGAIGLEVRVLDGNGAHDGIDSHEAHEANNKSITREARGEPAVLVVHLLINVCDAMGANAVNTLCEAVAPHIEDLTGGRALLRIVSNYADRRLARATFSLPVDDLACDGVDGAEVARRLEAADRLARLDPYRAATHNKGIFNGICAAALALGQDWRAIEAGGHAYAARDGAYRGLTRYRRRNGCLDATLELPLQVGWTGGAVDAHRGIRLLRAISGIENTSRLAGVLAAVGLAQNLAALLALCTDGIQKGHMALHARSLALSAGVPAEGVESVACEMIRCNDIKVSAAERIFKARRLPQAPGLEADGDSRQTPLVSSYAPGKVVLFGEHAVVYGYPGISAAINTGLRATISRDPDGPRVLNPRFRSSFPVPHSDSDIRMLSKGADLALEMYGLEKERIAIDIESDIVPGMGLGFSAAFSVALCRAFRHMNGCDPATPWDNGLFDEAQRLEGVFHGNPSGIDAATILSNGLLWFRKGPPRELLPLRIPAPVIGVVCIVEPAARTLEMVALLSRRRAQNPSVIDGVLDEIGLVTVDAAIALGRGDTPAAGRLMFRNHELLARLGLSTPGLDRAVKHLLDYGVLGAKLSGGGGGGAVVALVRPEKQPALQNELERQFPLVIPFTVGLPDNALNTAEV